MDCLQKADVGQKYLHGVDVSNSQYLQRPSVEAAIEFAERAHRGQKRKTGDPYIAHCIHTALILEELLDASLDGDRFESAVICAVLHDVLDDTQITKEQLTESFGEAISVAVSQISIMSRDTQSLRRRQRQKEKETQKEERNDEGKQLRIGFVKKLDDPIVLTIKLADRLHNLRTIYALAPEKQKAVAYETQEVFCTLAEQLGLFSLKPQKFWDMYCRVHNMWQTWKTKRQTEIDIEETELPCEMPHGKALLNLVNPFTAVALSKQGTPTVANFGLMFLQQYRVELVREIGMQSFSGGLDIDIVGRVKSLYSTYRKMQKKKIPIESVYDMLALRVIVSEGNDKELALRVCYKILELVQLRWKPIPEEFDDYILEPKDSGYQSLHVGVKGFEGIPFEVQIRTASMNDSAEYGQAAHWCYKETSEKPSDSRTIKDTLWGVDGKIIGHPVIRVKDGRWSDGIVIKTEKEGLAIIVAINISERMSQSRGSYTFALRASYQELLEYVKDRKWKMPGCGDLHAVLERYVLCSDMAYHLIDRYGRTSRTIVRPVKVFNSDQSLASHLDSLESRSMGSREMRHRIRNLRSKLERRSDIQLPSLTNGTIEVTIWPTGKQLKLPHGTTAADVLASQNKLNVYSRRRMVQGWVNVNNQLVQAETPLKDGDFVVMLRGPLSKI